MIMAMKRGACALVLLVCVPLTAKALSELVTPVCAQKLVMLASTVENLRVAGSSSESEPEKPLPNWAV